MNRDKSPLSLMLFVILGMTLGFVIVNGLGNSGNSDNKTQQIITDDETYYRATAIEENYDKAIELIVKSIENNKGEIITEKNEQTMGWDKPLREKTLKIKIPKENYNEFIKEFKNIEEKNKIFKIKASQENKTSDKEEKEVTLSIEEKIDENKVKDKLTKPLAVLFSIVLFLTGIRVMINRSRSY